MKERTLVCLVGIVCGLQSGTAAAQTDDAGEAGAAGAAEAVEAPETLATAPADETAATDGAVAESATASQESASATAPTPEESVAPTEILSSRELVGEPTVTVAPAAEPATESFPIAGYDKGFFLQSPDGAFLLKIGARIKTLYTFSSEDSGEGADRVNTNRFSVPYARLYFSGHLFDKKLTYLFNPGFGGGKMKLVLAYADYAFLPGMLHLTFGQMKRPFSRNYLTSTGKLAFINSPTGQFGRAIDLGFQLSNDFTKAKGLEWAIGVFNGANAASPSFSATADFNQMDEETGSIPVTRGGFSNAVADFRPALVARIGFNNGVKGYHPTDFEGGAPRFGVALSGHTDFNVNDSDDGQAYLSFDYILKLYGLSLNGGVYLGWKGEDGDGDTTFVWDDPTYARTGTFVQLQYLIANRFEPVFRYGIDSPEGDDNNTQEITAGFTVYVFGQSFKWENNVTTLLEEAEGAEESLAHVAFYSQLQFLF